MGNRKSDARVRYTRTVIRNCFLKLLKQKPVDRITVTELCELAEINRATFYQHYNDCFDLLSSIEADFLEQFRCTGIADQWCGIREMVSSIYDTIEENREVCDVLIFGVPNPALLTKMITTAHDHCMDLWRVSMGTLTVQQQDMLFTHLATGLSSVMRTYYNQCPRNELIDFMVEITNHCLEPYRRKTPV